MRNLQRRRLIWVLACIGISILWGISYARGGNEWLDFRAVYAGARCLIHHHNPYNVTDLAREYSSEDGQRPSDTPSHLQGIVYCINLPSTLVVVAPFALFSWGPACFLWMLFTGFVFILAILLMWKNGARYAPRVATLLACVIGFNCESIFSSGNTAGMVVGFCGIAVWSFLENRFARIGVICLALSLAVKPHDAGLIWLYFVLAGGENRKRALQSAFITAVIALAAVLWVSQAAPNWMHEWNANLATTSTHGGINDAGPDGAIVKDHTAYSIVDLQGAISIFRDEPYFYNLASYLICGALLIAWSIRTLRMRFSVSHAWIGLAAVSAFTLLITYHRLWDARLVILAIPACCLLWAEGGSRARGAILTTALAAFFTGEVTLVLFEMAFGSLHLGADGIVAQTITVALTRPASLSLLAMGLFYFGVYLRRANPVKAGAATVPGIQSVSE